VLLNSYEKLYFDLSGVRLVARYFGNRNIAPDNKAFGIQNRSYVTNHDKSLGQDIYEKTVDKLQISHDVNDNRIAAQLMLQRHLGLRKEESFKFNALRAVLKDGRVFVSDGTKGGRERMLEHVDQKAMEAINYTKTVASGKNTIPAGMSERQWNNRFYRTLRQYGISKKSTGASGHGLRHAFAQERYQKLTGFAAPVKFENRQQFYTNATQIAGDSWRKIDQDARLIIKAELGHGPDVMM
jgi:site-specific recombinase XerD